MVKVRKFLKFSANILIPVFLKAYVSILNNVDSNTFCENFHVKIKVNVLEGKILEGNSWTNCY